MGFEKIDKAEEVQRQVNQEFSNEPSVSDNSTIQAPLTNAENENLTQELSGEAQGTGFSEAEAEALTGGLSGDDNPSSDTADLYRNENPLNQNFEPLHENNSPQNYTERMLAQTDENKVSHIKTLIQQLNLLQQDSPEYRKVLSELEKEKFGIMDETELKNYITAKIWNAYNNQYFQIWENTLKDFYEYKIEEIDKELGAGSAKEFINTRTNLAKLVSYINEKVNTNTSNISKTEFIWTITEAISDIVESIILSREGNLTENITPSEILAALKSNRNPLIMGALNAYFNMDIGLSDTEEEQTKQSKNNHAGSKLMTDEEIRAYKEELDNLTVKELRLKISKADSLQQLEIINKFLETTEYSKSEKQTLYNECLKRQDAIQSDLSATPPEESVEHKPFDIKQNIEDQRLHSALSYDLFNICKTPVQREMARIILEDGRLYLASKDVRQIFTEIIELCEKKSDVETRQIFIEKILQNPKLLNENGALNNYIILCLKDINPDNLETAINLLNEYENTDSDLSGEDFANRLHAVINNKNNTKEILTENITNIQNPAPEDITDSAIQDNESNTGTKEAPIEYTALINEITENPVLKSREALKDFCSKILSDNELGKDAATLKLLANIVSSANNINPDTEELFFESVYNALKLGYKKHLKEDEISASIEEIKTVDYLKFINEFVQNKNKSINNTNLTEHAVFSVLERKTQLFENFTTGRSYTNELLYDLLKASQKTYCLDILSDLSKRKEFSAKDIVKVADLTSKNTVKITQQVLSKSDLTSEEKVDVLETIRANREQMNLIKLIMSKDELNLKSLPKILKSIKILDEHNAVNNHERINLKKLNEYTALLENPKTENWVINMLNMGFDIETILQMNPIEADVYYEKSNGTIKKITDKNIKFFMEFGMNEYEALSTVKAISKNGSINNEMYNTAVDMIQSGVPKDLIGEILNSANTTGVYNPHITADAMSVLNMGLNAFAERYLPIINNLSAKEIATQFSPYIIERLNGMLIQLPKEILPVLRAKGFDIYNIKAKLNDDCLKEEKAGNKELIFRDISEINGLEKAVIEKYQLDETVWHNRHISEQWADEKYLTIKKNAEHTTAKKNDRIRAARFKNWFDFIETNEKVKNEPCAKVLLADFVTNYTQEDVSKVPPAFDEVLAIKILAKTASKQKAEKTTKFEKTKAEIQELLLSQDYKAIFEKLGIKVEVMPDGSYEISHFTHFINGINIGEYGIDENKLLAKVSRIKRNIDNDVKKQDNKSKELTQTDEENEPLKKKIKHNS